MAISYTTENGCTVLRTTFPYSIYFLWIDPPDVVKYVLTSHTIDRTALSITIVDFGNWTNSFLDSSKQTYVAWPKAWYDIIQSWKLLHGQDDTKYQKKRIKKSQGLWCRRYVIMSQASMQRNIKAIKKFSRLMMSATGQLNDRCLRSGQKICMRFRFMESMEFWRIDILGGFPWTGHF